MIFSGAPISGLPISGRRTTLAFAGNIDGGWRVLVIPRVRRPQAFLDDDVIPGTAPAGVVDDDSYQLFIVQRPGRPLSAIGLSDEDLAPVVAATIVAEDDLQPSVLATSARNRSPWLFETDELPRVTFEEDYWLDPSARQTLSRNASALFYDVEELPRVTFEEESAPNLRGTWNAVRSIWVANDGDELSFIVDDEHGIPSQVWRATQVARVFGDDEDLPAVAATIVDDDLAALTQAWSRGPRIILFDSGLSVAPLELPTDEDSDWFPTVRWARQRPQQAIADSEDLAFGTASVLDDDAWIAAAVQKQGRTARAIFAEDDLPQAAPSGAQRSNAQLLVDYLDPTWFAGADGTVISTPAGDATGGFSGRTPREVFDWTEYRKREELLRARHDKTPERVIEKTLRIVEQSDFNRKTKRAQLRAYRDLLAQERIQWESQYRAILDDALELRNQSQLNENIRLFESEIVEEEFILMMLIAASED